MALTFSEKVRLSDGNKAFRIYEITHDGSATTINASDLEMNFIEYAVMSPVSELSAVADFPWLSGTTTGQFVTMRGALSSAAINAIMAWGW
jgi:hypothetical protein